MNFFKRKKVLVTGGTGFIGSHLVDQLEKFGAQITLSVYPNITKELSSISNHQIKLIKADLTKQQDCNLIAKNQDYIFNLAAVVGGIEYNRLHPASLFRNNSLIGINMLEAARLAKVKRFLTVSSACVYRREAPVPTKEVEGFVDEPEPTNYGYGWGKRVAELAAKTYHQEYGMNIAVVRPYNAYGPRDHFNNLNAHVIPSLISRVFSAKDQITVWGDGSPTRAFIYVNDVVQGMLLAIQNSTDADPINLGTSEEISIKSLIELIINISNKKLKISYDKTKANGQPRRNCDSFRAKELLGFVAKTNLKQGLNQTINWYKENVLKV